MGTSSDPPHSMLAQGADSGSAPDAVSAPPRTVRKGRADAPPLTPAAEPDSLLAAIHEHLGNGRFRKAQRLARDARLRYPEHPAIRQLDRRLNEWTATTSPGSGSSRTEEFEWLAHPPPSTRGKWIALVGSEMVGAAETLQKLVDELRPKSFSKNPLVVRID